MSNSREYFTYATYALTHPIETAAATIGIFVSGAVVADGVRRMFTDPTPPTAAANLPNIELFGGGLAIVGITALVRRRFERAQVVQEAERYIQEAAVRPQDPTDL